VPARAESCLPTEKQRACRGCDEYGLGLFNQADPYAEGVGHTGSHDGFVSWAGCLPEDGSVVVVLTNHVVDDIGGMAQPLVDAVSG